jgi:VanZ family protein
VSRYSRLVWLSTLAYLLLTVYASLYPFSGWRQPNTGVLELLAGPTYNSYADILLNVAAYLPLGLLMTLCLMPRQAPWKAATVAMLLGVMLSAAMEILQVYLPARVPSRVDIACNAAGAVIGAVMATLGGRELLSGRVYDYRRRVFPADTTTDLGFLLLACWAVTQLNPEIWLFGNGHLHAIFSWHGSTGYSPSVYALLEAGVAASGYCALILLLSSLARPRAPILDAVVVLTVGALGMKSIASAFLFSSGHLWLWVTPGSAAGLLVGALAGAILSRAEQRTKLVCLLFCLAATVTMVNVAPANPYLALLQVWQHGHYASFNATTRLLASLWPFVAMLFVMVLTLRRTSPEWNLRSLN